RVLLVDADAQGNASTGLGISPQEERTDVYEVFKGEAKLEDVLIELEEIPNLYVAPSSITLAAVDFELGQVPGRYSILREAIRETMDSFAEQGKAFDFVFIDCPPSMALLPVSALVAADEVLVPIQAEFYALQGVA
ncbi:AAA family ATPase, partial [Streptococcus anginosus]|nr:AAA family ATPase [Streptococcus anginosus]